MKGSLFMNQFEISLKKLQEKKGGSSKKRALSQRMTENPLFYLSNTKINGLSPSDEKELTTLCKRLQTLF
jgi:hypothetical protein